MNPVSKTITIPSILLIGTVIAMSTTNVFADDPSKNKVKIDIDAQQKNECDDTHASGTDSQGCLATEVTDTNTINVQGEKNKVDIDVDTKQKNECDGTTTGTSSRVCDTFARHDIGVINIFP
jgi:hypothetical protein